MASCMVKQEGSFFFDYGQLLLICEDTLVTMPDGAQDQWVRTAPGLVWLSTGAVEWGTAQVQVEIWEAPSDPAGITFGAWPVVGD